MNMNLSRLVLGACAIAIGTTVASPLSAQAFDWTYGQDSLADGTGGMMVGGGHGTGLNSMYELFGMAYAETDDTITFAFNSNMDLTGNYDKYAQDKNIGWGDLFLNLDPTQDFKTAQAAGNVLGIHFASTNDSGVNELGVYGGVTAKSVTNVNNGWGTYGQYKNYVQAKNTYTYNANKNQWQKTQTGSVELIDGMSLAEAEGYLGWDQKLGNHQHGQGAIASGNHLGGIDLLDAAALTDLGLDFGGNLEATGKYTFGFSFARSLLPGGELNWIAHVMAECSNDTMGMVGNFAAETPDEPVGTPEPSVMLGFLAVIFGAWQTKRHS